MQKNKRNFEKADPEELLASKLSSKLSWKRWKAVQNANNAPVLRNELQVLAGSLEYLPARAMYSCKGAYLPPKEILQDMLTEYVESNAISLHPLKPTKCIWVRLAIDNTKVCGSKVEGYYLSILDVEKSQSSKHQTILALSQTIDTNDEMQRVVIETDMQSLVPEMGKFTLHIDDVPHSCKLFLTLDWMGIVYELHIKDPKIARGDDAGCPFCGETVGVFRGDWWKDPFRIYTVTKQISDYPGALFPNLPLTNRRYCLMHNCNCILSIALTDIYSLFPHNSSLRTQYQQIIKQVHPKWAPKKNLEPIQTKAFFNQNIQDRVIVFFYSV